MPFPHARARVRYKIMMGRLQEEAPCVEGGFSPAEASMGDSKRLVALYGGGFGDENYQSAALGIGRDLSVSARWRYHPLAYLTWIDDTAYGKSIAGR